MPTTQQKGRPPTMADVLDAHLKAKKKRYTPGRMAYRYVLKRARNKRARRDLLNSLMILGFAVCVAVFVWGSQVAAAAGVLVLVLLVCEAWREIARWLYLNRRMQLPFVALGAMAAPAWLGLHQPSAALGLGLVAAAGTIYATFNLRARGKLYSDARGYVPRQWLPMFYLASYWAIAVPAGRDHSGGRRRPTDRLGVLGWLVLVREP